MNSEMAPSRCDAQPRRRSERRSGYAAPVTIRVRPCRAVLEHDSPLLIVGAIGEGVYTVEVLGRKLPLATEAVEMDERGFVALLIEGDYVFGEMTVRVGPWYDPEMPPGGEILIRVGEEPAARIHSSEVHLLMIDPRPSYLLTFDGDGTLDGWG
jgi:hypothetical protein